MCIYKTALDQDLQVNGTDVGSVSAKKEPREGEALDWIEFLNKALPEFAAVSVSGILEIFSVYAVRRPEEGQCPIRKHMVAGERGEYIVY